MTTTGDMPPAGTSSGGVGTTISAPPAWEPDVKAPTFDGATVDACAVATMLVMLKRYFEFLVRKGMTVPRAVEHVATQCLTGTAQGWVLATELTGTWEDFSTKFTTRFSPFNPAEKAGYTLLYGTYQNASSLVDYNMMFIAAINACDLVGFSHNAQILLTVYKHGLAANVRSLLQACPGTLQTYNACMAYLANFDEKMTAGSQPRYAKNSLYDSRLDKKRDDTRGTTNNNNNSDKRDTYKSMNAGSSDSNGTTWRSSAGRGSGSASRDGRKPRDFSNIDCHRCGVRGHIASECRSSMETVESFERKNKK